jgi:hypothetical protein
MKQILALIFISLFFSLSTQAQDSRPVRFAFGVMPSSAWIKPEGEIITKESSKIGFSYGILVDLMIGGNANYAFGTGIMISSQGGSIINTQYQDGRTFTVQDTSGTQSFLYDGFATVEEKFRLQYLEVPLTLKLKTNEIGYLTYYGQFGLNMSFNIKSRSDVTGSYDDGEPVVLTDLNVAKETNLLRMALQVGAGAEYNISGDTYLMAGVTWNNGLTNVFDRNAILAEEDINGNVTPSITENQVARIGEKLKGINNYLGLQLAVFF